MTVMHVVFLITAVVSLGGAVMVVTARNLIHAALWLILTLFGVAVMYGLLSATFFTVVQVVIYIGAIAILMIFAIMLTRRVRQEPGSNVNKGWWLAGLIALLLFTSLVWMLSSWPGFQTTLQELPQDFDSIQVLGTALVSPEGYVIPFEIASVLLLAALIGAVVVAWERKS
ncbi:MAG: NADH-quinone oxidoreductase subunit J [Anaerolineales bacterium]|jgi:NADH-quinone oxidoreductase subunit J